MDFLTNFSAPFQGLSVSSPLAFSCPNSLCCGGFAKAGGAYNDSGPGGATLAVASGPCGDCLGAGETGGCLGNQKKTAVPFPHPLLVYSWSNYSRFIAKLSYFREIYVGEYLIIWPDSSASGERTVLYLRIKHGSLFLDPE